MPKKTQTIDSPGSDAARLLAISYGTLLELGWTIKYAGENVLIAYTPKRWNKYNDEITIKTSDNQLSVTSNMIHGESFDMMGRNKKHLAAFLASFQLTKSKLSDPDIDQWNEKIGLLKAETVQAAEQEIRQAQEVENVMHFSKATMYMTYGIIGINVLVFLLMVFSGADIMAPTIGDLWKWGANQPQLTPSGEWWRLFTCIFVHIGIIHLLLNMYALYFIGIYLEPMLGKLRYIAAYLCAGVLSSLVSFLWHRNTEITSAGASGAIFGMYGVFLALLTTNLIPKQVRTALLQSILFFVLYNVFYGLKSNSGIDNSAHLGGLLSGMAIGYVYYLTFKQPVSEKKTQSLVGLVATATIVIVFMFLRGGSGNQDMKFMMKYDEVVELQNKAMAPLKDDRLSESEKAVQIQKVSLPAWYKASEVMKSTASYKLSAGNEEKRKLMNEYVNLRIEFLETLLKAFRENTDSYNDKLNSLGDKINEVLQGLNKEN